MWITEAYQKFIIQKVSPSPLKSRKLLTNDYNLNVPLYVMSMEEVEEIDIAKEYAELRKLEEKRQEISSKLGTCLHEITKAIGEHDIVS